MSYKISVPKMFQKTDQMRARYADGFRAGKEGRVVTQAFEREMLEKDGPPAANAYKAGYLAARRVKTERIPDRYTLNRRSPRLSSEQVAAAV